jgi:hypothetical protein
VLALEPIALNDAGFGITGATEGNLSSGWPSKEYDYAYGKVFAVFEEPLSKNWYIDIEPGIGIHRAWNDREDKYGVSLGVDLWFCYNLWQINKDNNLYTAIGGGFMGMLPSGGQPELSNSGVLGMFGGRVGYRHKVEKSRLLVDLSLGAEHFSDPFHDDDAGRNFFTCVIGFRLLPKKGGR